MGRFCTRTTPFWGWDVFTGVPTSSRRYVWRRHLESKMAAPEMTSTKTWLRWRWKMAALPLPAAILDDLIPSFRLREWGHPRWRPKAEGPPFSTFTSMGVEKAALYYSRLFIFMLLFLTSVMALNTLHRHQYETPGTFHAWSFHMKGVVWISWQFNPKTFQQQLSRYQDSSMLNLSGMNQGVKG